MKTSGLIILIVVLVGLSWYFYQSQYQYRAAPDAEKMMEAGEKMMQEEGMTKAKEMMGGMIKEAATIEMTSSGFSPSTLTIKAGDTVKFVNKDVKNHWPASGVHPTHQICPGFDAIGGVKPGDSYSFTFTEKKECPMHDHLNPSLRGKIIVE